MPKTILECLLACSDEELIDQIPYIRDENGDEVISLVQLKHILREESARIKADRETLSAARTP